MGWIKNVMGWLEEYFSHYKQVERAQKKRELLEIKADVATQEARLNKNRARARSYNQSSIKSSLKPSGEEWKQSQDWFGGTK